ncbi:hypothetical protein ACQBAT_10770 [Ornithinimicrobium sp. Y1847]|uniref:hypothetical protein n=1 Tax=unclassified Ornithinimicrobium TaxID=2615080 RepID=UPI003B67C333
MADPGVDAVVVDVPIADGLTAEALVVDAANVIGSVPDGWWRDRPGAAERLHAHLTSAALPYERVVLVLEGQARRGVAAGDGSGITIVHAPGSGDDEIVEQCRALLKDGRQVALATADRGLIARVLDVDPGVQVVGPRSVRGT